MFPITSCYCQNQRYKDTNTDIWNNTGISKKMQQSMLLNSNIYKCRSKPVAVNYYYNPKYTIPIFTKKV